MDSFEVCEVALHNNLNIAIMQFYTIAVAAMAVLTAATYRNAVTPRKSKCSSPVLIDGRMLRIISNRWLSQHNARTTHSHDFRNKNRYASAAFFDDAIKWIRHLSWRSREGTIIMRPVVHLELKMLLGITCLLKYCVPVLLHGHLAQNDAGSE